jgi:hypothetical protein
VGIQYFHLCGWDGKLLIRKKNKNEIIPSIVEAQGIVQTPDGQIYFVANANHATPSSQPTASPCPSQK